MSKSNNTIGNSEGLEYVILYHKGSTEFLKKKPEITVMERGYRTK